MRIDQAEAPAQAARHRLPILRLRDAGHPVAPAQADERSFGEAFIIPGDLGLGTDPPQAGFGRPARFCVPDVVQSEKLPGGMAVTGTALETAGLIMAVCDPSTEVVVPFAHVLSYREFATDGTLVEARLRPHAVARRRDGGITSYSFLPSWERDRASETAIRLAYRRFDVDFRVFTEHKLFARTARENRARMLRERAGLQCAHTSRVRNALGQHVLPTSVARFHQRAKPFPARRIDRTLSCLIELALAGAVALDLTRPLGPETRILAGDYA